MPQTLCERLTQGQGRARAALFSGLYLDIQFEAVSKDLQREFWVT